MQPFEFYESYIFEDQLGRITLPETSWNQLEKVQWLQINWLHFETIQIPVIFDQAKCWIYLLEGDQNQLPFEIFQNQQVFCPTLFSQVRKHTCLKVVSDRLNDFDGMLFLMAVSIILMLIWLLYPSNISIAVWLGSPFLIRIVST